MHGGKKGVLQAIKDGLNQGMDVSVVISSQHQIDQAGGMGVLDTHPQCVEAQRRQKTVVTRAQHAADRYSSQEGLEIAIFTAGVHTGAIIACGALRVSSRHAARPKEVVIEILGKKK